jgi:hypothetical protein
MPQGMNVANPATVGIAQRKKSRKWTMAQDKAWDKKHGVKEGSKEDIALDEKRGLHYHDKKRRGKKGVLNFKPGFKTKINTALNVPPFTKKRDGKKSKSKIKIKAKTKMGDIHLHLRKGGLKLNPPSKGHKPKGAHGKAAVRALGRTKTTGNFKKIEAAKGKGAAIAAYQNALKAHKAGKRKYRSPLSRIKGAGKEGSGKRAEMLRKLLRTHRV